MRIFLILLLLITSSCAHTWISAPGTAVEVLELAEKNPKKIALYVENQEENLRLGSQFALFIIPAGIVRTESVSKLISDRTFTELVLNGYRPVLNIGKINGKVSYPALSVKISEISLNAYDFFFFRLLHSKVQLDSTLYRPDREPVFSSSTKSETLFRSFGFKPQLERLLNDKIAEALNENLNNLNLK